MYSIGCMGHDLYTLPHNVGHRLFQNFLCDKYWCGRWQECILYQILPTPSLENILLRSDAAHKKGEMGCLHPSQRKYLFTCWPLSSDGVDGFLGSPVPAVDFPR